jgi:heme/copper-type cytochrome/quinol oxidase subunit 4
MDMHPKDLLMIDATIITGFLILLTISSFSSVGFPNHSIFVTITVFIIIIFSIACFYYLSDKDKKGMIFSKVGFGSIIAFVLFIGLVNVVNIIDSNIWSQIPTISK